MLYLSIVIVNYNVKEFLTQCIDSIYKSKTSFSYEVIVVDNKSSDSGEKAICEQFQSIHWINNPKNMGFGKANNIGFEIAKGKYTLILNPDTLLQSDTIEKCLNFLEGHSEVGGLGIKGIDGSGRFLPESKRSLPTPLVAFWKITGLSILFPKSPVFARYHLGHLNKDENHEVDVLAGCFIMVSTKVLREIQGFDTRYFMYGEDIDLSYELQKTGRKNIYFSNSRIIHYKGESTKRGSLNYVRMFYKAMILFAQKQFSGSAAWAYKLLIYIGIYIRASLAILVRIAKSAFAPAFDSVLLFAILNQSKVYWELNHRFINGGSYPDLYTYQIQGSYVFVWILGLWIGGAYYKTTQPKHLIGSMFFTTLLIGFAYGLLPEELRFSRALLVIGALIGTPALLLYRTIISLLSGQRYFEKEQQQPRIIFYGKDSNFELLRTILKESNVSPAFIWRQNSNKENDVEILCTLIKLHKINELIIDIDSIGYDRFIELTVKLGSLTSIKSLLPHQGFIIGSDSSLSQGTTYKKQYSISDPNYFRQRRIYEIVLTFFVLAVPISLFTAIIFERMHGWKVWIQNAGNILIGKRSLIGYTSSMGKKFSLPEMPEPIFDICRDLPEELDFPQNAKALIEDYAKEAQIQTDLLRLWQLSKF